MLKKILPLLVFGYFFATHTQAQQLIGLSNSNYAGVNGVYLNPSSIADSRYGFQLNLVTLQNSMTNNYYRYNAPYSLLRLALGNFEAPYDLRSSYYREVGSDRPKFFDLRAEARLPSLMISLSPKHSVAFTNRIRASFESLNLTEFIANDFRLNQLSLISILSNNSLLRLNANGFRETGLTYAREVWTQEEHYIKGGLTLKYLQGIYSNSLYSNNLQTQIGASNGQVVLRLLNTDIGYHYTQPRNYPSADEWGDAALWRSRNGRGVGADIGFTYEYRPVVEQYRYPMDGKERMDERKNKYLFRVGLSFIDVGRIRYTTKYADTNAAGAFIVRRQNAEIPQQDLTNASLENYYPILNRGLNTVPDRQDGFRVALPTMLHLNVDYKVHPKLYINAMWLQSLRGRNTIGMRHNSLLAVTPRFEIKHFEFSLPLSLVNNYQQATFGAMIRLGSFLFVGSDNVPGLFNIGRPFGTDIYAGFVISGLKAKPKDRDADGVSDKEDLCPDTPGVWAFRGCPDTDADGVEDKEDKCPAEAGLKELGGCPDKDGDKIIDSQDKCPNEPGLAKYGGCPDSDNDGVIDSEDECPLAAGTLRGCPDKDGDDVADKDDRCPDEKGQAKYNGCTDNDGDNIANPDDACPDQAGTPRFNGCPDRDGDTVPDKDDRCPDTYGTPQNAGCPGEAKPTDPTQVEITLTQEEQKVLNEAFDNLEFETGKLAIKVASYESLDGLASLLKEKDSYRLLISGHTDNVGNAATNLKLSKARADAVKKYLTRKGVKADQLITEGFGSRKPIASNKTPEGRQKNRRVEMKVIK